MAKTLLDLRSELRLELNDMAEDLWTDDELNHCIYRAIDNLSRHLPLEKIYEEMLVFAVTAEVFTTLTTPTWIALANKPIKPASLTVTNAAGTTTYTKDTDYVVDYSNGKIKYITGSSMAASTGYLATYTKSQLGLDISSLISTAHRVTRVEFPVGSIPQKFSTFSIYGDFLFIQSQMTGTSQAQLTTDHIAIWYETAQSYPTESAAGSYPSLLNDLVMLGASGYALMILALESEHDSTSQITAITTVLADIAALHTLTAAASAKYITYLEDNTNEDAAFWMKKITTDLACLRSAMGDALAAAKTNLGLVFTNSLDKATTGAEAYLDTGDGNIAAVTAAPESDRYVAYANARANIAMARINAITQYLAEAASRQADLQTYIQQSEGWANIARGFGEEATFHLRQIEQKIAEAGMRAESTQGSLVLSDRYRTEGQSRLNEFESKLRNRAEYRRRTSSVASKQPA